MRVLAVLLLALLGAPAHAVQTWQTPEAFVGEAFGGAPPAPQLLWLDAELRQRARDILQHEPAALRTRYWRDGARTAWILEEIGRDEPITVGLVVEGDRIERVRVLIYRETRGWEIRHDFFTRQFDGARLGPDGLDRNIDNISGATLSVNAMRKLAALALVYHARVNQAAPSLARGTR